MNRSPHGFSRTSFFRSAGLSILWLLALTPVGLGAPAETMAEEARLTKAADTLPASDRAGKSRGPPNPLPRRNLDATVTPILSMVWAIR